ncbi:putative bifunctional methylthioribulose-1-phosphate dehydratase/enolase-phosphatase E1 [Forsythia ovata]|uniref:Bifunctional methylthioribulose-1-phosphate dehydratase/enolase-phosphatase E1 n=1 Tax=Forsythia ovata TaxID=205694 RepID=A0ABD1XCK4_9LAMI
MKLEVAEGNSALVSINSGGLGGGGYMHEGISICQGYVCQKPSSSNGRIRLRFGMQKERVVDEDMYVLSTNGSILFEPLAKPWPHIPPRCFVLEAEVTISLRRLTLENAQKEDGETRHYMSASAQMWASTHNDLKQKVTAMLCLLVKRKWEQAIFLLSSPSYSTSLKL